MDGGLSDWNASRISKTAPKLVPIIPLAGQDLSHVKPRIGGRRFPAELVHIHTCLGYDRPKISKSRLLGLLMGFLCLTSSVVGVADIRATFDLNRNLVAQLLSLKLLLVTNVWITAQGNHHLAFGSVRDDDLFRLLGDNELLNDLGDGEKHIQSGLFTNDIFIAPIELSAKS